MIDLVCVVRCDNKILYDRLKARGYAEKKLQENLDCEIMEVLVQEARDAYDVRTCDMKTLRVNGLSC